MAKEMFVEKLHRITLVRKGRGMAKHPDMREGVVDVIKSDTLDDPLYDWYEDFSDFLLNCDPSIATSVETGESTWEGAFASYKESAAGKKDRKNYPDGSGPFAGPHNSFPISSQHHVYAAAKLVGHAANPAAVKAAIIRIAHEKGYSLPKSWTAKTKKAEDTQLKPEVVDAALAALRTALLPEGVEEPKVSAETPEVPATEPEVPETPAVEEETEKAAKAQPHSHDHAHASTYGYTYSHGHVHGDSGHSEAEDHSTSETLHAHVHVAKSGGDPEMDGLLADVTGLKQDLDNARAEVETLKAELATVQAAQATTEAQKSEAEVKAQDLYKNLLRRPLTAPTQTVEKSAAEITKTTPWDEAFAIALGRQ